VIPLLHKILNVQFFLVKRKTSHLLLFSNVLYALTQLVFFGVNTGCFVFQNISRGI
jgi:hypothetical protein